MEIQKITNFNPRSQYRERQLEGSDLISWYDFNPRSQYRERQKHRRMSVSEGVFQSTLPIQGATYMFPMTSNSSAYFNPRSQYRERRDKSGRNQLRKSISIHAPNTGSDTLFLLLKLIFYHFNPRSQYRERPDFRQGTTSWSDFNPRSQYRERPRRAYWTIPGSAFQSTLPIQGATDLKPQQIPV